MKCVSGLFVILGLLAIPCNCGNILAIFPRPAYSHFAVFYPIMQGLVEHGHNVTVVSYFPIKNASTRYREIRLVGTDYRDVVYLDKLKPSRSIYTMFEEFFLLASEGIDSCNKFFDSDAKDAILKSHSENHFDLMIYEIFNCDCILGFAKILNVPVVGLSSCALMPWHYDRVGLPDFPAFTPSEFVGYSSKMSFFERSINFFMTKSLKLLYRFIEHEDNKIISKYLNINCDVHDLATEMTNLILVNQHYSLSGARLLSNKVIEIGGIHIDDSTESVNIEDKNLEKFLDTQYRILFINWGSMVRTSSIPKDKLNSIIAALQRLPIKVIWKWETNETPVQSEQFFYNKWYSQKDILCHPNVTLFWSHGGLLSISEACYCGVPVIVTPIYGDQFLNGKAAETRKFGKILPFENISEESVYANVLEMLKDKYKVNAKYVSKFYRNREHKPLNTALWWIEHVLENKGGHLTYSPSVELNWFIYYSVDAITLIAFLTILGISLCIYCTKLLCCRKNKLPNSKNKRN